MQIDVRLDFSLEKRNLKYFQENLNFIATMFRNRLGHEIEELSLGKKNVRVTDFSKIQS